MIRYGGIEAGGTKFVCMIASGPGEIDAEIRFPTTTPEETLGKTVQFFRENTRTHPIAAIGVGSFGPVDLNPSSPTWGSITTTPKPGWSFTSIAPFLKDELQIPIAFDTDVNVAALGEYTWGNPAQVDPLVYFTIGTGIGAGIIVDHQPLHGLVHPEAGHMRIPHDRQQDPFEGSCPFHGDCFEGLACGGAIQKRWGARAETLPANHPAWALEAHYIALAVVNTITFLSPGKIVLGGGVMEQKSILPVVRSEVKALLNGYVHHPAVLEAIDEYLVPPVLGNRSGVLGAIALASSAS